MYYKLALVLLVLSCILIFKFTINLIVNDDSKNDKYKPQIVDWPAHLLILDPSYLFNNLVRNNLTNTVSFHSLIF